MIYASRSERGKRENNEDNIFTPKDGAPALVIVADGMGGHNAGERASALAVATASGRVMMQTEMDPVGALIDASNEANAVVYEAAKRERAYAGMGTTMVMALLFPTRFVAANVGDSRLYHYKNGTLRQVTVDHSLVEELVESGLITREEALHHPRRNIITRALGTRLREKTDIFECEWGRDDILMLCSDGLYEVVPEGEIISALRDHGGLQAACDALVESAIMRGSNDNISVVLAKNGGGADA